MVSIDLKGAGYSDKPADGRYRVADQAEIVTALIQMLKLDDVTLIGHSLGGGVVLMTALQSQGSRGPKRLVLIDSAGISARPPQLIAMLRLPFFGPMFFYMANPDILARQILSKNYWDPTRVPDALVRAYADSMRSPGGRAALIMTARQVIPDDYAALIERYRTLELPVLVLWCRNDRILPFSDAGKFREALPHAEVLLLDRCGHSPQEEVPNAILQVIEQFLASERLPTRQPQPP